jgi:CRP/FNR family transcriptional regulator, cyclic AMP receptor protein
VAGKTSKKTASKAPRKAGAKGEGSAKGVTLEELRRIPAFSAMSPEDAARFLPLMKERTATEGEPLFREGEAGAGLYAVLDGSVSIHKKNKKGGDREVAVLDRNEVFGEMDLISDRLHTSGARCRTACRLLLLPRKAFQDLLRQGNPGAAGLVVYFARMLAGRLESSNKRMLEILDGQAKAPGSTEFAEFKRRLLREWSF